jgi:hypothetical protein
LTAQQSTSSTKGSNIAKLLLILGLGILLASEAYFGLELYKLSHQQKEIKEDYSETNNIMHGLFSADQWQDEVAGIIKHQVRDFSMTKKQKRQLQLEVEEVITAVINKAEALVNKPTKTFSGKIKKFAIKTFVNTDKIKAQVPSFARTVIAKADNRDNKKKMSSMALGKFEEVQKTGYIDSTTKVNIALNNTMYRKYHVSSRDEFNQKVVSSLAKIKTVTYNYCFGMLACIAIVLSAWWIFRKRTDLHATLFIMSLLFAFILLAVGLTASMIEVDARIRSLDFVLLGEHVVFKNQVLFFQSKSILDVVHILMSQSGMDSVLVGALILIFSILFPIMKLSSTGIHLLGRKSIAENRFIKYFAFQSGKWSMADVIVIAIMMTYIGLNGLLETQLANLNVKSDFLTIITTNNTALQPGFIVFISFVLYGLILSTILKYITPYDSH